MCRPACRFVACAALAAALLPLAPPPALAGRRPDVDGHVRTADPIIREALAQGLRQSPTLRTLVDRLRETDVVVYLLPDDYAQRRLAGRLTFLSAAAGIRYLVVRLNRQARFDELIAAVAHELQHALEIADAPEIVDSASLEREYRRLGYVNPRSPTPGVSFDSHAAVEAGRQVLREVAGAGAD